MVEHFGQNRAISIISGELMANIRLENMELKMHILACGLSHRKIITDIQTQGKYDSDTNGDAQHTHSTAHMARQYRINRIDSLPIT